MKKITCALVALAAISTSSLYAGFGQSTYTFSGGAQNYDTSGNPISTFTAGESGVTVFNFTLNGQNGFPSSPWTSSSSVSGHAGSYFTITPNTSSTSFFSSVHFYSAGQTDPNGASTTLPNPGSGTTFTQGTTYFVTVDWTISPSVAPAGGSSFLAYGFGVTAPDASQIWVTAQDSITVAPSPVPEPSQDIACAALLGCGGLVFIGRRFMKKQTA